LVIENIKIIQKRQVFIGAAVMNTTYYIFKILKNVYNFESYKKMLIFGNCK